MSTKRGTVAFAAALSVAAALAVAAPGASGAPTVQLRPVNQVEAPIEHGVTSLRLAADLPALRHSAELTDAADAHAATLVRSGTFTHDAPGEKSFAVRLQDAYTARGYQYWATGENLFWAHKWISPAQVIRAWLASPPHRANMYDPRWRQVGVAAVRVPSAPGVYANDDVTIVVIEFGTRRR